MFFIKAGTQIQIYAPFGDINYKEKKVEGGLHYWHDTAPWKPYTTKEDKIYEKDEVWDLVAVMNEREDVPEWAKINIQWHGKTVLNRNGKYALVNPSDIQYID